MKSRLDKQVHVAGGNSYGCIMNSNLKGLQKHPYMRQGFWLNPSNQFWHSDLYTDKAKQYFNESVERIADRHNKWN